MTNESKRPVKNFSSIQVSSTTKDRLKSLALTPRESYENIVLRLINTKLGNREIIYNIHDTKTDCNIDCVVDWSNEKENIMFFNGDGDRKFNFPVEHKSFDDNDWGGFREFVLENTGKLICNLSVLDVDEKIVFGRVVLSRVS